jgi:hypothetical protein
MFSYKGWPLVIAASLFALLLRDAAETGCRILIKGYPRLFPHANRSA